MSAPTEIRLAIARRVVTALAERTELRASLLTGSVAQGTCDERSDIDLLNYYDRQPDRAAFDEVLGELGARLKRDLSPPGAAEFVAGYDVDGIELQTGAELTSSLEAVLCAIQSGDVNWATAKTAMGLQEGVALYGRDLIADWQGRLAYPEALRRREIEANAGVFPIWSLTGYLGTRDAALFQRQMLIEGAFRVLAMLSALNGLYFSTFQFKRMGAHAERLRLRPDGLAQRLVRVAEAPSGDAAAELGKLVAETKEIVRAELPDIDVDTGWRPPAA